MFFFKFFLGLALFFVLALVASALLAAQHRFESRVYYQLTAAFFLFIFFFVGVAFFSLIINFIFFP